MDNLVRSVLAGGTSEPPLYIDDVFNAYLYTGDSAGLTIPQKTKLIVPENVDPDWVHVKRLMPLLLTRSYDVITNTYLSSTLTNGEETAAVNPFYLTRGYGASAYAGAASGTVDHRVQISQPTGANYNSPWCIEGWAYAQGTNETGDSATVEIHSSISVGPNTIRFRVLSDFAVGTTRLIAEIYRDGVAVINETISIGTQQWTFCSLSYDGTNIKVHTNGTERYSAAFTGWTTQPTNSVYMGPRTVSANAVAAALLCQYRATFGTARTSTRTIVPTAPFPTNGSVSNCTDALLWFKKRSDNIGAMINQLITLKSGRRFITDYQQASGSRMPVVITNNSIVVTASTNSNINATNATNFVAWSFTKQSKFFDIVEYVGNSTSTQAISHSLGVAPGLIIVKDGFNTRDWAGYHVSLGNNYTAPINSNLQPSISATAWNSTTPTSTQFFVGNNNETNAFNNKYTAFLFAHDTGPNSVVKCGTFTTDGSGNADINLGWEAQFVLIKRTNTTQDWEILDTSRGWVNDSTIANDQILNPNGTLVMSQFQRGHPTATGFYYSNSATPSAPYIYMAIRRSNKPATTGAEVFSAVAQTGEAAFDNTFPVDLVIEPSRTGSNIKIADRLRGRTRVVFSDLVNAEGSGGPAYFDSTTGTFRATLVGGASPSVVYWNFKRTPGFFDIVCYSGTGAALTVPHNLSVAPELVITKPRSTSGSWTATKPTSGGLLVGNLFDSSSFQLFQFVGDLTSTSFTAGFSNVGYTSTNGVTYVAYLFASLPGISKVGDYVGNGSSQTINCGFTTGARFVLVKRTDSTGDWYVWDTARGIVSGNDPRISLNSPSGETTIDDSIDPTNSGFIVNQVVDTNININAATYIYLAIS